MARIYKYRIVSNRDGVVSMSVKVPEFMLGSFLAFLEVKKKQVPTLTSEESKERQEKYFQYLVKVVSKEFDKILPNVESHRKAISLTRASLHDKLNLSHENIKLVLRRAGRLKGTRL